MHCDHGGSFTYSKKEDKMIEREWVLNWWEKFTDFHKMPYVATGGTILSYCHDKKFMMWDNDMDVIIGDTVMQREPLYNLFKNATWLYSTPSRRPSKNHPDVRMTKITKLGSFDGEKVIVEASFKLKINQTYESGTIDDIYAYSIYKSDIYSYRGKGEKIQARKTWKKNCAFFIDISLCNEKKKKDGENDILHRCKPYYQRYKESQRHGIKTNDVIENYPKVDLCGISKIRIPKNIGDEKTRIEGCKSAIHDIYGEKNYKNVLNPNHPAVKYGGKRGVKEKLTLKSLKKYETSFEKETYEYLQKKLELITP